MAVAAGSDDPFNVPETEAGIPVRDELVIAKCGGCHASDDQGNLSRISWVRTTPEGWAMVVKRMVALNGVSLTPQESRAVVRSLGTSHGLAPEEAASVMYFAENRMLTETNIPNETVRQACASCHAFAQPLSWRRSNAEWRLLRNLHVALYSQADAQFRRPVDDPEQPKPAGDEPKPLPIEVALAYMNKVAPLHTPAWSAWQARMQESKLAGRWLVSAWLPGRGSWAGEVVVTPGAGAEDYTTAITLRSLTDGTVVQRSGKGVVYAGYSWRGSSTGSASAGRPEAPDNAARETMWFAPDRRSAQGRWFWGDYNEFGFDVKLTRASAGPTVVAVMPYALKAGTRGGQVTIHGDGFPAGLTAADIGLGRDVTIRSVRQVSASEAVVTVDVAANAAPGPRDVNVAGSVLQAALPVYDRVDYLKVLPETATARLGGTGRGIGFQQFDAFGYANGLDGKSGTADDFSVGPVEVDWAMQELPTVYYDDDVNFVGTLSPAALFTPNLDGPNPERRWGRNNYGEVWVAATARSERDPQGRPLTARAFMVVTVPAYRRWDRRDLAE